MSKLQKTLIGLGVVGAASWVGVTMYQREADFSEGASVASDEDAVQLFEVEVFGVSDAMRFEELLSFGASLEPRILDSLPSAEPGAGLERYVGMLGAIGSAGAVGPLIDRIESPPEGVLSEFEYATVARVPVVLGAIHNRTGDPAALDYLVRGIDPSYWADRIQWTDPVALDASERDHQLAIQALLGLAFTGSDVARDSLLAVATRGESAEVGSDLRERGQVARQALTTFQAVTAAGLEEFLGREQVAAFFSAACCE